MATFGNRPERYVVHGSSELSRGFLEGDAHQKINWKPIYVEERKFARPGTNRRIRYSMHTKVIEAQNRTEETDQKTQCMLLSDALSELEWQRKPQKATCLDHAR